MSKIPIKSIKEALDVVKSLQKICRTQRVTIEELKKDLLNKSTSPELPLGFDKFFR